MAKKPKEADVSIVPQERIEVLHGDLDIESTLPKTTEELNAPLPPERKECLRLITCSAISASKHGAIRMWYIGRILDTLTERGEENVFEEASTLTDYKSRQLKYCLAIYRKFPNVNEVSRLSGALEAVHFKALMRLRDHDQRMLVGQQVLDGDIPKSSVPGVVEKMVNAEKGPSGDSDEEPEPPKVTPLVDKAKALFSQAAEFYRNTVRNVQTHEQEIVEMLTSLGDPSLVADEEFDSAMEAFEEIDPQMKRVTEEIAASSRLLEKEAEKAVKKGKKK